jgi:hypothetical protein
MADPTPQQPFGDEQEPSQYAHRTVRGDYEARKSVQAQARKRLREQRREQMVERLAQMSGYGEYLDQVAVFREIGAKGALKQTVKNIAQRVVLKRISPWLLWIALIICFWQFVFALASLVAYLTHAVSLSAIEKAGQVLQTSVLGTIAYYSTKATNYVVSTLSSDGQGLTSYLPMQYVGDGFWAIAFIIGIAGFVGFMLFFHLMGITLMRSSLSTLILMVCLSLTILPFSNIFPWLVLWVFNVIRTETSVLGMALEHHKTKRAEVLQT